MPMHQNLRLMPPIPQSPAMPTARELAVAELAMLSNREIAATLGISPWTVKVHLANLTRKTGISGRAAIAVWADRKTETELTLAATDIQRQEEGAEQCDSARATAGRACLDDLRTSARGLSGDPRRAA